MSVAIRGVDELTGSNDPVNISQNKLHIAQYVWDTNTLSWIRQTGGASGPGTEVTVTNFPATQQVQVVGVPQYALRYDYVDATTSYLGKAAVGSSESGSVWQIQKLVFNGDDVSIYWADGDSLFNNNWSNRASLSYV